jgi:hypothetical protein
MEKEVKEKIEACETIEDLFNILPFIVGKEIDLNELDND